MKTPLNRLAFWMLLALLQLPFATVFAASHTWSGAVNGYFSNPGNWSSGGVPTLAETNALVFPAGAARFVVTNDVGALRVSLFNFSGGGYVLRSATAFTIAPNLINIQCNNSNVIEAPLTSAIVAFVSVGAGDSLVLSGAVTGTGGLGKFGDGDLYLRGATPNTFTGGLYANFGEVILGKTGGATAAPGPIFIGGTNVENFAFLSLERNEQIGSGADITVQRAGGVSMRGWTNTVNSVTLLAGSVQTFWGLSPSPGLLRLNGGITLVPWLQTFPLPNQAPVLQGQIEFSGANGFISVTNAGYVYEMEADVVESGAPSTIRKIGRGTLSLKGDANNYTGTLQIEEGRVIAGHSSALGAVSGATIVEDGGTLELPSGFSSNEPLTLAGLGNTGQGAILVSTGSATLSGAITVAGEAGFGATAGSATLTCSGVVGGAGGIRKLGAGTLLLTGSAPNTYTGSAFVAAGRLMLNKNTGVRAIGSAAVTNGAQLVFGANEQMDNAGVLSIYTGGAVDFGNRSETLGGLNLGNVTVDLGTGLVTTRGRIFAGPPYITNYNHDAVIRGNLSLGGGQRVISTDGTSLYLDCHISDGAGVGGISQEWDGGAIFLMRSNSFTGPVSLAGLCYVSNTFALGAPGGGVFSTNVYQGYIGFADPTLSISGENIIAWERGVGFISEGGTNAWYGSIALLSNTVYNATYPPDLTYNGPGELAIHGVISGPGSVKVGDGTLRLTAANTYSKGHFLGGTLVVQHPNALGVPGLKTYLAAGYRLVLQLPDGAGVTGHTLHPWVFAEATNAFLEVVGGVSNFWNGPIEMDMYSAALQVNVPQANGTLALNSRISGAGGLEKVGPGRLFLSGASTNSFPGDTVVNDGTLVLNKPHGVPAVSNLTVLHPGKVIWAGSEQIPDAARLRLYSSVLANVTNAVLTGFEETVHHLAMHNGRVGGGTLGLLGDVDLANETFSETFSSLRTKLRLGPGMHRVINPVPASSGGSAYLFLYDAIDETGGAAGLAMSNAYVRLFGSNTFSGPVVVDRGDLGVAHPSALGSAAAGTFLTNSAGFTLSMPHGSMVAGEALEVAPPAGGAIHGSRLTVLGDVLATNTWAGPVTVRGDHVLDVGNLGTLVINGPLAGNYPLHTADGPGQLILAGNQPNTITGLWLERGVVRLAKTPGVPAFGGDATLFGNDLDPVGVQLQLDASNQFAPETAIVAGSGSTNAVFALNGHAATISGLMGKGSVRIGTGTLTIQGAPVTRLFEGTASGAPGGVRLVKQGLNNQGFFGTNLFGGAGVLVQGGGLGISGGAFGSVDLSAGAFLEKNGGDTQIDALSGAGRLVVNVGRVVLGGHDASSSFAGGIEGLAAANLLKVGNGTFTLTGASTFLGQMLVQQGGLFVNGSYAGPIRVQPGAAGQLATLGGAGTLGNVVVTGVGARIAPGASTNVPSYGRLSVNNIALDGGALFLGEMGGTSPGVNLDQIEARDTTTFLSAAASFTAFGAGAVSNRYAVWKSFAPANGKFQGLNEGSTVFPSAGRSMQITYAGGANGREIVLMDLTAIPPSTLTGIQSLPNGTFQIAGNGTPGVTYEVQANTNLNTASWITIGTVTGNFNGELTFTDPGQTRFPMRFYRFLLP